MSQSVDRRPPPPSRPWASRWPVPTDRPVRHHDALHRPGGGDLGPAGVDHRQPLHAVTGHGPHRPPSPPASCARPPGSPSGSTRTTPAGWPPARSATCPWWSGSSTATSPPRSRSSTCWRELGRVADQPAGRRGCGPSTGSCARSPTTSTPTPATPTGGSAGSGAARDPSVPLPAAARPVIKYLGSKRRLVPALTELARGLGGDAPGSTCSAGPPGWPRPGSSPRPRRSPRWTAPGLRPRAGRAATWPPTRRPGPGSSGTRWPTWSTASTRVEGRPGYVTATFCEASRYFRPENGARIDAMRDVIESRVLGDSTPLAGAADQPARGGRPGGLDHRPADGLPEAVGRPGPTGPSPSGSPSWWTGPGRAIRGGRLRPGRLGRPWDDVRPGLPRPALQPAPLRLQLPRVGDHRGLGRAHPLRGGLQAGGPAGPRPPQRRSTAAARSPRPSTRCDGGAAVPSWWSSPTTTSPGWTFEELHEHVLRPAATSGCWPSTRPGTSGPGSASTTPPGSKVGAVSHLRNTEYLLVAGDRARVRRMVAAVAGAGLGAAGGPAGSPVAPPTRRPCPAPA